MMQTQEIEPQLHSMRFTGSIGHAEIVWDAKDNDKIRAFVQKKMDEGVRFFMIKTTSGLFKSKRLKDLDKLERRRINVHDADLDTLAQDGAIRLVPITGDHSEWQAIPGQPTAEEVASGDSVALRPQEGG
jgi:hypothetical protein